MMYKPVIQPLKKSKFNRNLAVLIEEYIYKMFSVTEHYNLTDALFYPNMYAITMPLNALLLLRITHPAITKIYDIPIQIGYSNSVIVHNVKFPKSGQAVELPLRPDKLGIAAQNFNRFYLLFPPYFKIPEVK